MSFSLANPLGWASGDTLTPAQINQLDTDHVKAIDGTGGGTYTLASPLTLQGSTVTINSLSVPTTLAAPTISGNISVAGSITSGTTVSVGTNITVGGTLAVTGISTLTGNTTVTGTLTANGGATLGGNTTIGSPSGAVTVSGAMGFNGVGRILHKAYVAPTGDTIDITAYKYTKITKTSTDTFAFTETVSVDFDWFEVYNASAVSHNITGVFTVTILTTETIVFRKISGSWQIWKRFT